MRGEHALEALLDHAFRSGGGTGPGYTSIVAAGDNATILHYVVNEDVLEDAGPDAAHDCMPGTARDCGRNIGLCRAGRQTCGDDGRYGPCEGGVEPREDVCNGADDDCNGTIDDGFPVGMPCEGEGVCGAGVIECRTTVLTRCSTQPGGSMDESGEESCNDLDDDCDGSADEGLGVGEGCVGACGDGLTVSAPRHAWNVAGSSSRTPPPKPAGSLPTSTHP